MNPCTLAQILVYGCVGAIAGLVRLTNSPTPVTSRTLFGHVMRGFLLAASCASLLTPFDLAEPVYYAVAGITGYISDKLPAIITDCLYTWCSNAAKRSK